MYNNFWYTIIKISQVCLSLKKAIEALRGFVIERVTLVS